MASIARVALVAILALLSVGSAVAQTASYTFCYQLTGLPSSTLDDPYSLSVLVSGTYNSTLMTSTATKYTPAGTYYTLLTGSGTRVIRTRNNKNVTYAISSLAPLNTDFSDNRFYISNTTQFVDGDGLTFNLAVSALFPGKTYATQYNVYRSGTYGAVLEDKTSGEDLTRFAISANIAGWTGAPYTGTCLPPAPEARATPPPTPTTGAYNIALFYNISSTASETPSWNVVVKVTFQSTVAVNPADAFGDHYLLLNSTANVKANGTRTYCIGGACSTSAIYRAALPGLYTFSDNRVYLYKPYLDYNGIGYLINPSQPKPGFTASNYTSTVNPYVSKAGQFFEGFGQGGTGSQGSANFSRTVFTVAITKA